MFVVYIYEENNFRHLVVSYSSMLSCRLDHYLTKSNFYVYSEKWLLSLLHTLFGRKSFLITESMYHIDRKCHFLPPDEMRLQVSFTPRELNDPALVAMSSSLSHSRPSQSVLATVPFRRSRDDRALHVTPLHTWPCSFCFCSHLTSLAVAVSGSVLPLPQRTANLSPGPLSIYHFPILPPK